MAQAVKPKYIIESSQVAVSVNKYNRTVKIRPLYPDDNPDITFTIDFSQLKGLVAELTPDDEDNEDSYQDLDNLAID